MIKVVAVSTITLLFFLTLLWFGYDATFRVDSTPAVIRDGTFAYRLHEPDALFRLDDELDEVSGLAYVDEHTLAMVNDEKGNIYLWNRQAEDITGKIDFGKSGDYEGITLAGSTAYVLRSDGDVYEVTDFYGHPETVKHENPLSSDNDAEGLAYDAERQQLLIACKATGRTQEDPDDVLAYRFSPTAPDVLVPALTARGPRVHPSGIALHPRTHHYYLLSSADRQLLMFDTDGQLLQTAQLARQRFPQPEGICFSPEGTLYIASEGRHGQATLLQFNPTTP